MDGSADRFIASLDARIEGIINDCTMCGKCAAVCPTPDIIGIRDASNEAITAGVIDILKGGAAPTASEKWARACCGTGHCIDACPEGINPRFMLAMSRRTLNEKNPEDVIRSASRSTFKGMSAGVRMLSRLQLPPELLSRINPAPARSPSDKSPDLIFYTGCNMLKTPHIGLICLDVFDRIGVTYEVYGGPANCCGIMQFRPGDTENAGRQALKTIERFQQTGAPDVVAWCPTCHIHFNEVALPSVSTDDQSPFDMHMLPTYLADRLDELKPHLTTSVPKRVAFFEFPGAKGVTAAVRKLMDAIPGLQYVDLGIDRAGYQMSALETMPDYRSDIIAGVLKTAEDQQVDVLCSVFHSEHRELSSHADAWPFEIKNYMDLIAESMGIEHDDLFQRLKIMQDADRIVAEMADTIASNNLDLETMRNAVLEFMLGDQLLPINRDQHPKPRV